AEPLRRGHHLAGLGGDGLHRYGPPPARHVDGDGELHEAPLRSRGFSATFRPSPSMFSSITSTKIAAPGNPGTHHAFVTYSSPLVSICPRLTTFGSPTPRKLSDASARMAEEPSSAIMATTGGRVVGRISRNMRWRSPAPRARALCTKASSFR